MRAVCVLFEVKPGKGQTESRSFTCLAPCNFLLIDALLFKSAHSVCSPRLESGCRCLVKIWRKQTSVLLSKFCLSNYLHSSVHGQKIQLYRQNQCANLNTFLRYQKDQSLDNLFLNSLYLVYFYFAMKQLTLDEFIWIYLLEPSCRVWKVRGTCWH